MNRYYHRTDHAGEILRDGFRDSSGGSYGIPGAWFTGVWISSEPLDANEGADGERLLEIELGNDLAPFEIVNVSAPAGAPREWCVPAAILNTGEVRELEQEDEDELWLSRP